MNVSLDRDVWMSLVSTVAPAACKRSNIPVLQCMKATADERGFSLVATDAELTITARSLGCQVVSAGSCLIPFDVFRGILSESPGGPISIKADCTDPQRPLVNCVTAKPRYTMPSQLVDEFPDYVQSGEGSAVNVSAGDLSRLFNRVAFAVDRGAEDKFATKSIVIELTKSELFAAATDTALLSVASIGVAHDCEPAVALLNQQSVAAICKAIGDPGEMCRVEILKNQVVVSTERATVVAPQVHGRPFPFNKTIEHFSKSIYVVASVGLPEFLAAWRQIGVVADKDAKRVKCEWAPTLRLSVLRSQSGQGDATCDFKSFDGDPLSNDVTPSYLIGLLTAAKGEGITEIAIKFGKADKPFVLELADNWRALVMPLGDPAS